MAQKLRKPAAKKNRTNIGTGVVHIQSTFNNTIVTITNVTGDTISWASAGSSGFKGARKGTPFAAQTAAEKAALEALSTGIKTVEILVKGQGSGRETAIRSIEGAGLEILSIQDITLHITIQRNTVTECGIHLVMSINVRITAST